MTERASTLPLGDVSLLHPILSYPLGVDEIRESEARHVATGSDQHPETFIILDGARRRLKNVMEILARYPERECLTELSNATDLVLSSYLLLKRLQDDRCGL